MEITYLGHSCFKIKNKEVTLLIDPYDPKIGYKEPRISCDALLITHDHYDHSYKNSVIDYRLLVEGPGEYEFSNVYIMGFSTFHDDSQGADRGKNTIYLIEIDDMHVLHLGDLGHELSKDTLEKLPDIDVLMIPVGGVFTIDSEVASKVISSIAPKIVIPMHYQTEKLTVGEKLQTLEQFLEEMGNEKPETSDKLIVTKASLIEDDTQVVVLKHTH